MENKRDFEFPDFFPKGCPPKEAKSEELTLYRFCAYNPPSEQDFLSYYQLNPAKYEGVIDAYGLSTFLYESDCRKALKIAPSLRKNCSYLASVVSYNETGVVQHTPSKTGSSHHTWWLYDGVLAHNYVVACCPFGDDQ